MIGFMFHPSTERFFPDTMHGWNAYANDNNKERKMDAYEMKIRIEELEREKQRVIEYAQDLRADVDSGKATESSAFHRLYGYIVPAEQWPAMEF